jgi:hypothetical protein
MRAVCYQSSTLSSGVYGLALRTVKKPEPATSADITVPVQSNVFPVMTTAGIQGKPLCRHVERLPPLFHNQDRDPSEGELRDHLCGCVEQNMVH